MTVRALLLALLVLTASCEAPGCGEATPEAFVWDLPTGFPEPSVPADNPMSRDKVELGRRLFYDERLSVNQQTSCGTCHLPSRAFTDGLPRARGTTGETHARGAMSLANVAYSARLAWANPLLDRLEAQALLPMFGDDPVEMGLGGHQAELLAMLRADDRYPRLFAAAFPGELDPVSVDRVTKAIAAFERTILSGGAPYDHYLAGDDEALSAPQKRGMDLFFSERLECFHCHGGVTFSDSMRHDKTPLSEVSFHNTGLYNLGGEGAYPADNTGVYELSKDPRDMGRFKAPTLRNIAVTAPYMHDGSIETLPEVIEHYAAGGRTIESGPRAGVGSDSPRKSEFVPGFVVTEAETADVVAFLEALTDEAFLRDPRFSDPFAP